MRNQWAIQRTAAGTVRERHAEGEWRVPAVLPPAPAAPSAVPLRIAAHGDAIASLGHTFGQLPLFADGQSPVVVQRQITAGTVKAWDKARPGRRSSRRETGEQILDYLQRLVRNPYDKLALEMLPKVVDKCLRDPNFAKYHATLGSIEQDLQSELPATSSEVTAYLDAHKDTLFPEKDGDFADPRVNKLRYKILENKLLEEKTTRAELDGRAPSMAKRGVLEGQWSARGLCQEASKAWGESYIEVRPKEGSPIDWNHYYNNKGTRFVDTTWKQFFKLSETEGLNPIFEGAADDFRKLDLSSEAIENYLIFIGKAKRPASATEERL